jgi:spore germination protein D
MLLKQYTIIHLVLMALILSSCGTGSPPASQSAGPGYKDTKTMVMDILKSADGQKTIKEASQGGGGQGGKSGGKAQGNQSEIQLLSTGDSQQLQTAVKDVITAPENAAFLTDMMKDPKFAGEFAKAIQKHTKQMQKDLLKDPEYQTLMVNTMKNPEYEKILLDTMKQSQYRQQMMTVIQESMQSPLFRAQLVDLLKTAMSEQSQPKMKSAGGGESKKGESSKSGSSKKSGGSSEK